MKLIEITNTTTQTIVPNSPLVLGNISRRVGCFTDYSAPATTITLRESGYYQVILKVNATATAAAQAMEITLFLDGTEVPESLATSVGTAIGDVETLNSNKIFRVFACSDATLSVVNTGDTDTAYSDIVLDVLKVN